MKNPGSTFAALWLASLVALPAAAFDEPNAAPLAATPAARLRDRYDIIIAGAGTGGCGAAVQAARLGRSVLLLEETDWIGGQMNAAAVTSMDEGVTLVRERGLYRELCGLIAAHYQPLGIHYETAYWHGSVAVEPRVGRTLLLRLLSDARRSGVLDLALRSRVIKVLKQGDAVTGVEVQCVTEGGQTTRVIASKILIDATEWGDVIPLTGARYRAGNSTSDAIRPAQQIQDLTWTAVVKQYPQGVPPELRVATPPPGYAAMVQRFESTLAPGDAGAGAGAAPKMGAAWHWERFIGYRGMPDSTRPPQGRSITRTHLNYNNDYPATVADLEQPATRLATCRAAMVQTLGLLHYLQTTMGRSDWSVADDEGYDTPYQRAQVDALLAAWPELKPYRAVLIHFPVMPYARESRRIIGLHTLTAREIERKPGKPVQFPHTVALGDYAVDLHGSMTPPYLELELDRPADIPSQFGARGLGPFAIPFECFIPEKVDGFLPAEKNLSQSRLANGATRLQPSTLLTGQAAGAIAALAVQHQVPPRALDPRLVQRVLLDAGCTLAIAPVAAPWGSAEWKAQQFDILRGTPGAAKPLGEAELLATYRPPKGMVATGEPSAFVLAEVKAGPEQFNYVVGTQTFSPAYQFTKSSRLVETAEAIRALGCSAIKFELAPRYARPNGNVPAPMPGIRSLADLARDEPSHRQVLDMPFGHYVLWAHTFSGGEGRWRKGFAPADAEKEYRELYDLATHLLRTYRGSGKIFYLGHWEGDGWLRGSVAPENDARVTPVAAQGMADWLNTRQRAVDDAKRDTPPERVQVWHYTEVNHVKLAMQGRPALVNEVLPKTTVDLVSYSSYDTQYRPELLKAALSFIEAKLPPKPGLTGRRVFIGEYGFPAIRHPPPEQDRLSSAVIRAGLEWGCPLVLYWELYNNEVGTDGQQRGFWLIDDQGVKQPVYETHQRFLQQARRLVADRVARASRPPTFDEFRRAAVVFLEPTPNRQTTEPGR